MPIRDPLTGPNRMRVGQPGLCVAHTAKQATALMHDMQQTSVPTAMLTVDPVEEATKATVRDWKNGIPTIRNYWLTQLGTGEGGLVVYVGATPK